MTDKKQALLQCTRKSVVTPPKDMVNSEVCLNCGSDVWASKCAVDRAEYKGYTLSYLCNQCGDGARAAGVFNRAGIKVDEAHPDDVAKMKKALDEGRFKGGTGS